jgi:hypothetical protein
MKIRPTGAALVGILFVGMDCGYGTRWESSLYGRCKTVSPCIRVDILWNRPLLEQMDGDH